MADEPIASAYVEIRPDLTGFKEDLKAGLDSDMAGTDQSVHIDADTADLDQKITTRRQALAAFGAQKYSPTFDADDTELQAKLDDNIAKAQALSDKVYSIKVRADDAEAVADLEALKAEADDLAAETYTPHVTASGVDETAVKIAALDAEVDEFGAKNVTAKVNVDSGDSGKNLDDVSNKADSASRGLTSLTQVAVALAPALVTSFAAAAAGLGGFLSLLTGAGAGFAGIAAVAAPAFSKISAAVSATTAAQQAQTAGAVSGASSQGAALQTLQNAQRSYAQSVTSASQQQQSAQSALSQAEESYSSGVLQRQQQQQSALETLTEAQQSYNDTVLQLQQSQQQSQLSLLQAQQSYSSTTQSNNEQDAQAKLTLQQAQDQYNQTVNASGTTAAQAQSALLTYQQAQLAYQATINDNANQTKSAQLSLQQAQDSAANAVVNNADQQVKAQEQLKDAQTAYANQAVNSTNAQTAAVMQLQQAQDSYNNSVVNTAAAEQNASASLSDAEQTYQQAISGTSGMSSALATAAKAWADLTPAEAAAATELQAFEVSYKSWAASFEPQLFSVFGAGLTLVSSVMHSFTPIIQGSLTALGGLVAEMERIGQGSEGRAFMSFLASEAPLAISVLGQSLINIGGGFAGLVEAFAPVSRVVGAGIESLTADFERWGQSLSASSGFQQFIEYAKENAPLVGQTLENLGHDFILLGQDLGAVGPSMLQIVNAAAELLGDLLQLNPTIAGWAISIASVTLEANKLLGPLGGITGAVGGVRSGLSVMGDAAAAGSAGIYSVATAAGGGAAALARFGSSALVATPGLDLLGAALLQQTGAFSNFDSASEAAGKSWAENFINAIPQGVNALTAAQTELGTLGDQINTIKQQMTDTGVATSAAADKYQALGNTLQTLTGQQDQLQKIIPGLTQAQDAQNAAAQTSGLLTTAAASGSGLLGLAQTSLTTAENDLTTATGNVNTQLTTLFGSTLSAKQAADQWEASIVAATNGAKGLGAATETTSGNINLNTAAGLAASTALDGLTASTESQIQTMVKQGATTQQIDTFLATHITDIEHVGNQYGLTKTQIDAYLTSVNLTPGQVNTTLQVTGYDTANTQIQTIGKEIADLQNKTISITVTGAVQSVAAGLLPSVQSTTPATKAAGGTLAGFDPVGAGFKTTGAQAIVGEGRPQYPEYVVPTDPAYRQNAHALTAGLLSHIGMPAMATGGVLGYTGPTLTGLPEPGPGAPKAQAVNIDYSTAGSFDLSPIASLENSFAAQLTQEEQSALASQVDAAGGFGAVGDAASIVARAQSWLGTPYRWGGGHGGPVKVGTPVDCSGLVDQVFGVAGTTYQQVNMGSAVNGMQQAEPADLLFFSSLAAGEDHHVGIYTGGGKMIDAPFTGTVVRYDGAGAPSQIRRLVSGGAGLPGGSQSVPGGTGGSPASNRSLGAQMASAYGWGGGAEFSALDAVFTRESGWNNLARNASSGAYGIPQALPPTKLPLAGQAAGGSQPGPQIGWGLDYIKGRYGDPVGAEAHERSAGWYASGGILGDGRAPSAPIPMQLLDNGGYLPEGLSIALNNTGAPEAVPGPGFHGGGFTWTGDVNVNGAGISDPVAIGRIAAAEVQKTLTEFMAAMG